jgi:hypothetical protein
MAQGGTGPGSKLITLNRTRWTGDFLNAGSPGAAVTAVSLDLMAPTSDPPLRVRIAMKSATSQGAAGYVSTTPFDLPNDGFWHHAIFVINSTSLTGINIPVALNTFLQSVAEFRILHSANPSLDGDSVIANLGADNITPIPEPSAVLLAGLATLGFWRQRRQKAPPDAPTCSADHRAKPAVVRVNLNVLRGFDFIPAEFRPVLTVGRKRGGWN